MYSLCWTVVPNNAHSLNTTHYLSNLLLGRLLPVPSCSSLNCVLPLNLKVEPRLKRLTVDGRLTISVLTVLYGGEKKSLVSIGVTILSLTPSVKLKCELLNWIHKQGIAENHSASFPVSCTTNINPRNEASVVHFPYILLFPTCLVSRCH